MIKNEKKLRQLIGELRQRAIDNSWKGAGYPEDVAHCENRLRKAEHKLDAFLKELNIQ